MATNHKQKRPKQDAARAILACLALAVSVSCCSSPPGGVTNKVMTDFGFRAQPEGHVSATDKVYARLSEVGEVELKRLNRDAQKGEIKYQEKAYRGLYHKEVKVYDRFTPLDARALSRSSRGAGGYSGFIEYVYVLYRSPGKSSRTEAQAALANIPTDTRGRETLRYRFSQGGQWNGRAGDRSTKR